MSKPPGTTFAAGTTIESAKVNSVVDDIITDLNTARPIVAGGTGATSASGARTNLAIPGLAGANTFTGIQKWAKGADVASAATLTLGDDGNYFDITGTTAITAIATKGVGTSVLLQFDAALTLTHHATDLVLPGGANITTAAGDHAEFVEYATGDWRCVNYVRAADTTLDVASATTTDIGAGRFSNIRITGTTTITGLGTAPEGTLRFVRMAGALTLTHNATSLILPGSANITTAANDCFLARSLGSGNWLVMFYQRAAGYITKSDPSVAKAWLRYNGVTNTLVSSYNITSVSRTATGTYTVTIDADMPDANYSISGTAFDTSSGSVFGIAGNATIAAGSFSFIVRNTSTGANTNVDTISIQIFSN